MLGMHLSNCLCNYPAAFFQPFMHVSIYLSVYRHVSVSMHPPMHPSTYLSICLQRLRVYIAHIRYQILPITSYTLCTMNTCTDFNFCILYMYIHVHMIMLFVLYSKHMCAFQSCSVYCTFYEIWFVTYAMYFELCLNNVFYVL